MAVIDRVGQPTGVVHQGRAGHILEPLLLWDGCSVPGPGSNLMIRRSLLKSIGGFDEQLSTAADQEFCFRLAARSAIGRIPRIASPVEIPTMAASLMGVERTRSGQRDDMPLVTLNAPP